jgi:hypothetical protein
LTGLKSVGSLSPRSVIRALYDSKPWSIGRPPRKLMPDEDPQDRFDVPHD